MSHLPVLFPSMIFLSVLNVFNMNVDSKKYLFQLKLKLMIVGQCENFAEFCMIDQATLHSE